MDTREASYFAQDMVLSMSISELLLGECGLEKLIPSSNLPQELFQAFPDISDLCPQSVIYESVSMANPSFPPKKDLGVIGNHLKHATTRWKSMLEDRPPSPANTSPLTAFDFKNICGNYNDENRCTRQPKEWSNLFNEPTKQFESFSLAPAPPPPSGRMIRGKNRAPQTTNKVDRWNVPSHSSTSNMSLPSHLYSPSMLECSSSSPTQGANHPTLFPSSENDPGNLFASSLVSDNGNLFVPNVLPEYDPFEMNFDLVSFIKCPTAKSNNAREVISNCNVIQIKSPTPKTAVVKTPRSQYTYSPDTSKNQFVFHAAQSGFKKASPRCPKIVSETASKDASFNFNEYLNLEHYSLEWSSAEEKEDLLTSHRTHFRPIVKEEQAVEDLEEDSDMGLFDPFLKNKVSDHVPHSFSVNNLGMEKKLNTHGPWTRCASTSQEELKKIFKSIDFDRIITPQVPLVSLEKELESIQSLSNPGLVLSNSKLNQYLSRKVDQACMVDLTNDESFVLDTSPIIMAARKEEPPGDICNKGDNNDDRPRFKSEAPVCKRNKNAEPPPLPQASRLLYTWDLDAKKSLASAEASTSSSQKAASPTKPPEEKDWLLIQKPLPSNNSNKEGLTKGRSQWQFLPYKSPDREMTRKMMDQLSQILNLPQDELFEDDEPAKAPPHPDDSDSAKLSEEIQRNLICSTTGLVRRWEDAAGISPESSSGSSDPVPNTSSSSENEESTTTTPSMSSTSPIPEPLALMRPICLTSKMSSSQLLGPTYSIWSSTMPSFQELREKGDFTLRTPFKGF